MFLVDSPQQRLIITSLPATSDQRKEIPGKAAWERTMHKYGQSFLLVVSSHRRDEKFCLSRRTSVHDWFVDKSPKQFLLLICTAPFFFVKWKIIVIKAHFPFYLFLILRNFPSFKWLDTRRVCVCVDHHQTTTPGHWQKNLNT